MSLFESTLRIYEEHHIFEIRNTKNKLDARYSIIKVFRDWALHAVIGCSARTAYYWHEQYALHLLPNYSKKTVWNYKQDLEHQTGCGLNS